MATWPSYTQQPNPYGERDRALRKAGTTPAGYYQTMFNVPQGAGATSYTRGGGTFGPGKRGMPLTTGTAAAYNNPQNYREFSALTPDQKRAYMQANPTGIQALQSVHNQPMADQGYGPGASTWQGAPAGGYATPDAGGNASSGVAIGDISGWVAQNYQPGTTTATGGSTTTRAPAAAGPTINASTGANLTRAPAGSSGALPPINPGEDSMAYMLRIGMSPEQAQSALTMAQQNPGMSFQDILSKIGTAGGAGAGSTTTRAPAEASSGDYPPINPGEDSAAYMARIGMSQSQIEAALAMAKANPGMSFQEIMSRLQSGGGGSTGNTGGVSIGNIANGSSALGGVNGVPGYGGTFNLENWKDPGYDFRLAEGKKLLEGSAAARGNLLSGPTLKAITNYGQDAASQEYANAYNRFTGNRAFNYGVDVGDRAFDYTSRIGDRDFAYRAQVGDRDYNKSLIDALIQSGQYGTTGATSANDLLARLISANLIAGGGANAASTVGGGNAITDAITRWLNYMGGQNTVNAATQPTPTK